jgi:CDP-4-dehydro-6-deoxyglucose reductase
VLECREVGTAKDIPVKIMPCRVQRSSALADDVIILSLKLPANERLQFLAGQYIEFLLKDGKRRAFPSPTRRMMTASCNCTSA